MKIVAKGLYYLHCIINCSELRHKWRCFHWVLSLSEPDYQLHVTEQQDSSMKASRLGVSIMVYINTSVYKNEISSMHWIVLQDCYAAILVKPRTFTILKKIIIYDRVRQVKTQFSLWMQLLVTKYTNHLLKVTNKWNRKVTWKKNDSKRMPMHPISTAQKIWPMRSWKQWTPYTFNFGDS